MYLTFREAHQYSRIPRRELRRLLREGLIHSRTVGRRIIIPKEAIDRFLSDPERLPEKLLRSLEHDG